MDDKQEQLFKIMFNDLYSFMKEKKWVGACHATTAMMYALCKASGIDSYPLIGEVAMGNFPFDHSWLEIDNEVYDIAIALPLNPNFATGPIFKSLDIRTNKLPNIRYGIFYRGLDMQAEMISQVSIYDYLKNSPELDLLQIIIDIANKNGIKITKKWLKDNLSENGWYELTQED